jgi:hypothetical protein
VDEDSDDDESPAKRLRIVESGEDVEEGEIAEK